MKKTGPRAGAGERIDSNNQRTILSLSAPETQYESEPHLQAPAPAAAGRDDWDRRLGFCDSYSRTHELAMAMLHAHDPRRQLKLFADWGNLCDAPWAHRSWFAEILREAILSVGLTEVLDPDEREWFRSLPSLVEVVRGCERERIRGLSWTTDLNVAIGFARGKRCRNKNPTLARAIIPKTNVLGLFLTRDEHEVVVDPRRLRQITIETVS